MCLKMRGTFVSFGNASGKLDPVDVGKLIAPKGLFLTRPSIAHYTSTREELDEAANMLFEMIKSKNCLLYTSPSPRDLSTSRMPSSA